MFKIDELGMISGGVVMVTFEEDIVMIDKGNKEHEVSAVFIEEDKIEIRCVVGLHIFIFELTNQVLIPVEKEVARWSRASRKRMKDKKEWLFKLREEVHKAMQKELFREKLLQVAGL